MRHDQQETGDGNRQRCVLEGTHALAVLIGGERHGEEDLRLHHERRQGGRDLPIHGNEQDAELAHPDEQAIGGQIAPRHRRPPDEKYRWNQGRREAQRREHQRRQILQTDMDDDKVATPHRHDGDGEQPMSQRNVVGAHDHAARL